MGYDVFISYRHADGDAARGVSKLLRAFSQSVFIDEGIAAGAEWAPEIWQALAESRSLIVLWSRNAEKSPYVQQEWTRAPEGCRVIALKLDGAAFPAELGRFNAITGLDVAGRLIARSVELMKERKLSPAKAQDQLLQELAADGVVLEEKQKQALAAFLPALAVVPWWLSSSLATFALAGGAAASTFGIGFWVASAQAAPRPPVDVTINAALPASGVTAATIDKRPPCADSVPVNAPACAPVSEPPGAAARPLPTGADAAALADCHKKLVIDENRLRTEDACQKKLETSDVQLRVASQELKRCQSSVTVPSNRPPAATSNVPKSVSATRAPSAAASTSPAIP